MISKNQGDRGKRGIYWEQKGNNGMGRIISHIKEARKSFFNREEEGRDERERVDLTFSGFGLRNMHFGVKIYLTLQESRGEGDN